MLQTIDITVLKQFVVLLCYQYCSNVLEITRTIKHKWCWPLGDILRRRVGNNICEPAWDMYDAMVACRELGYRYAISALQGGQVPSGSGRTWLNYVHCAGQERNLSSCFHAAWGESGCDHSKDVGVQCSQTGKCKSCLLLQFFVCVQLGLFFHCLYSD